MNSSFDAPTDWGELLRAYWDQTTTLPHLGVRVLSSGASVLFSNPASNQLFYDNPNLPSRGSHLDKLEPTEVCQLTKEILESVNESSSPVYVHQIREGVLVETRYGRWQQALPNGDSSVLEISHAISPLPSEETSQDIVRMPYVSWGPLSILTARQLEVLSQLRLGLSQKDAADVLGVSQKTIETHRDQLVRRLSLNSTLDAIRLADRAGLTLQWARTPRVTSTPWRDLLDEEPPASGVKTA